MLRAYRLFTYAVPPCWYNYAFIHQSRTSLLSAYRLFTYAVPPCWYNYAFYIKAALPCSVHTGSSHTLYLLAGTIMRLYIKAALPCSVHTGSPHTLFLLAGTIMRFTSKPHFLAQCIQALHIRCTSLLVQLCVLHQSRTSLLSAYRLFTYAVPPCWYNYTFIHQSRTSLLSAYRLFTYAVPPCLYNYAFYIKAALPCSVHTGYSHTLYLLAGTIMRFTSKSHFLAQCIQALHIRCTSLLVQLCVHTSKPHFLDQCIQALHIRCTSLLVQLCVLHQSRTSLLSAYRLFTYAVPPCWYNYAFYIKAALP